MTIPKQPCGLPAKKAHLQLGAPWPRLLSGEGLLCVAFVALCILLIWPVAGVGVQDDPVYTFTALDFARTGHFIFHGWASPMLGWQAVWGALFSKLFGATFTAVRLSMAPVALLSVLLYHSILRRFGLNPAHATFGTLAFVAGPLFLPLSVTFMTDVPGIFAVLVCLYFCQLAMRASSDSKAIFFLTLAALSNVALGSARQIAWLGLLVMVPCCTWLLRRRHHALQAGMTLWVVGVICIRLMSDWFAHQPYTAPEKLMPGRLDIHLLGNGIVGCVLAGMTILLFLLPALTLGLSALWPIRRGMLVKVAAVLFVLALLRILFHQPGDGHRVIFPWLGVTFGVHGILEDGLIGSNPAMPAIWQGLLFAVVVLSALGSIEMFIAHHRDPIAHHASQKRLNSWREISILLLPFMASTCAFLLPRAIFFGLFDRYLLEIIPFLLVFILRWHQDYVSARIPLWATATIVLIAVLTVADMHGLFAAYRAQVRLANKLQDVGVPRSEIRGGLAFDMMTQVHAWGYVNDRRILNPPDAFKPQPETALVMVNGVSCGYYSLQQLFPALHPRYEISAFGSPCLAATNFPPEIYRAWLPPFTRKLFVRRVLSGEGQSPS